MKKILLILIFLYSFSFSDEVKQFTLACDSYKDITNTKKIEKSMKNGTIPKNCILLTSNAEVSIIDDKLEDPSIVKIFIHGLESHMYSLKEDIIITNINKI